MWNRHEPKTASLEKLERNATIVLTFDELYVSQTSRIFTTRTFSATSESSLAVLQQSIVTGAEILAVQDPGGVRSGWGAV